MSSEEKPTIEKSEAESGTVAKAPDRRRFLQVSAAAICGGSCAAVALPALKMVAYPIEAETVTGRGRFVAAGPKSQFVEGEFRKVDLVTERRDAWNRMAEAKIGSVWVIRRGTTLQAFSTACPHLGCSVDRTSATEAELHGDGFICRCHDSFFAADGSATTGPSPRGLDELEIREAEGQVEIRFQRFRYGTPEKIPV